MGPYFGPLAPESSPIVRRKSFWECEADYNPLGTFGASSSGAIIREALTRDRAF